MKKSSFFKSLPFKLLVGVVIGILAGLALNANDGTGLTNAILNIIVTLKYVLGQIISFCVPLIIIGFIAPSITKMGNNASRLLLLAVCIAYVSSVILYSSRICADPASFYCDRCRWTERTAGDGV